MRRGTNTGAKIAQRVPGASAPSLDQAQLDQVKDSIKEASLDVYSGKDDHILRKLSLSPSAGANRRVQAVLTYLRA